MTQELAAANPNPLLFGRYRIQQHIGTGRLTTVYHATDERLKRDVLIHILRKEFIGQEKLHQRFIEEINAAAQRSHLALLDVYDSGEASGRPFMVTEYVQGRPLNSVGALTIEHALLYIRQVTGAISSCLTHGLPYPPISSSNILLVNEGQIKLVENWTMSSEDIQRDLAYYRAPEITEGQSPSSSTVVYALGLLLYELITGVRPASGEDAVTIARSHGSLRIPPLSQTRPLLYMPTLQRLITRATNRFPEQRLRDVIAFSEEIDALWRNLSNDTQRLMAIPAMPQQHRPQSQGREYPQGAAFQPTHPQPNVPTPTYNQVDDTIQPLDPTELRRKSLAHGVVGWVVMMILLIVVVFGSYTLASFAVEQFFEIKLPRPNLASFGIEWSNWFSAKGEPMIVNINSNEGLNMRSEPGLNTQIVTTVKNGTIVYKLGDPLLKDDVQWVRVRAQGADGKQIEGWMSLVYLKPSP